MRGKTEPRILVSIREQDFRGKGDFSWRIHPSLAQVSGDRSLLSSWSVSKLETVGHFVLRYGLVFILVLFGTEKWTTAEAQGIQAWVAHSPFMFWIYRVLSVQAGSEFIGGIELLIAALIVIRRWFPMLCAIGSLAGVFMFLITLSFIVTTPNIDPDSKGFLLKDIFLLGASIWSAGEALRATRK